MSTSKNGNAEVLVAGGHVDGACLRFIHQARPNPGGNQYELRLRIDDIDNETLAFAAFSTDENPSRTKTSDWMYWLGHIVSRLHEPEDCKGDVWVANNIVSIRVEEGAIQVSGECSPWVNT